MSEGSRDKTDHDLFRPALHRLFREHFDKLGGESCRDLLHEMLESRWDQLAAQLGRPMPIIDDGLLAFDSLKYVLLGDIKLLDLTLPELWRYVKRARLKHWLWLRTAALGIVGAVAAAAFELGTLMGK